MIAAKGKEVKMWGFTYSEEQEMLKNSVRQFAEKEIKPQALQLNLVEEWPWEIWEKMAELKMLCPVIPTEYGGGGLGYTEQVIIEEELATVSPSICYCQTVHEILCADNIHHNANEEQKKKYLPKLCTGEWIGSLGITEPIGGSDAVGASLQSTAVRKDSHYIINGQKVFISNAPVSRVFLYYAKTAPELGTRGVSLFIIERDFPGFEVGKPYDKLGGRCFLTAPLYLDDCKVPAENLVGKEGGGAPYMMAGLNAERVCVATYSLGCARGAFEDALRYAQERVVFGQPIIQHQMIAEKIADMAMEVEAARLLIMKAAYQLDHFGRGREQSLICSHAKLFATDVGVKTSYLAFDIYGGYGYMMDNTALSFLRDALMNVPGAGSPEVQRYIISRDIASMYKAP
jgi:alkylation response protein AidB-like acyl-CoA dehydrogenase